MHNRKQKIINFTYSCCTIMLNASYVVVVVVWTKAAEIFSFQVFFRYLSFFSSLTLCKPKNFYRLSLLTKVFLRVCARFNAPTLSASAVQKTCRIKIARGVVFAFSTYRPCSAGTKRANNKTNRNVRSLNEFYYLFLSSLFYASSYESMCQALVAARSFVVYSRISIEIQLVKRKRTKFSNTKNKPKLQRKKKICKLPFL